MSLTTLRRPNVAGPLPEVLAPGKRGGGGRYARRKQRK